MLLSRLVLQISPLQLVSEAGLAMKEENTAVHYWTFRQNFLVFK
jgi:hypothetical protein